MSLIRRPVRLICLLTWAAAVTCGVAASRTAVAAEGTPAEALQTLPDFKVERLISAEPKTNGSWINLGLDDKGRLLLGGQNGQPVTRVTINAGKVGQPCLDLSSMNPK